MCAKQVQVEGVSPTPPKGKAPQGSRESGRPIRGGNVKARSVERQTSKIAPAVMQVLCLAAVAIMPAMAGVVAAVVGKGFQEVPRPKKKRGRGGKTPGFAVEAGMVNKTGKERDGSTSTETTRTRRTDRPLAQSPADDQTEGRAGNCTSWCHHGIHLAHTPTQPEETEGRAGNCTSWCHHGIHLVHAPTQPEDPQDYGVVEEPLAPPLAGRNGVDLWGDLPEETPRQAIESAKKAGFIGLTQKRFKEIMASSGAWVTETVDRDDQSPDRIQASGLALRKEIGEYAEGPVTIGELRYLRELKVWRAQEAKRMRHEAYLERLAARQRVSAARKAERELRNGIREAALAAKRNEAERIEREAKELQEAHRYKGGRTMSVTFSSKRRIVRESAPLLDVFNSGDDLQLDMQAKRLWRKAGALVRLYDSEPEAMMNPVNAGRRAQAWNYRYGLGRVLGRTLLFLAIASSGLDALAGLGVDAKLTEPAGHRSEVETALMQRTPIDELVRPEIGPEKVGTVAMVDDTGFSPSVLAGELLAKEVSQAPGLRRFRRSTSPMLLRLLFGRNKRAIRGGSSGRRRIWMLLRGLSNRGKRSIESGSNGRRRAMKALALSLPLLNKLPRTDSSSWLRKGICLNLTDPECTANFKKLAVLLNTRKVKRETTQTCPTGGKCRWEEVFEGSEAALNWQCQEGSASGWIKKTHDFVCGGIFTTGVLCKGDRDWSRMYGNGCDGPRNHLIPAVLGGPAWWVNVYCDQMPDFEEWQNALWQRIGQSSDKNWRYEVCVNTSGVNAALWHEGLKVASWDKVRPSPMSSGSTIVGLSISLTLTISLLLCSFGIVVWHHCNTVAYVRVPQNLVQATMLFLMLTGACGYTNRLTPECRTVNADRIHSVDNDCVTVRSNETTKVFGLQWQSYHHRLRFQLIGEPDTLVDKAMPDVYSGGIRINVGDNNAMVFSNQTGCHNYARAHCAPAYKRTWQVANMVSVYALKQCVVGPCSQFASEDSQCFVVSGLVTREGYWCPILATLRFRGFKTDSGQLVENEPGCAKDQKKGCVHEVRNNVEHMPNVDCRYCKYQIQNQTAVTSCPDCVKTRGGVVVPRGGKSRIDAAIEWYDYSGLVVSRWRTRMQKTEAVAEHMWAWRFWFVIGTFCWLAVAIFYPPIGIILMFLVWCVPFAFAAPVLKGEMPMYQSPGMLKGCHAGDPIFRAGGVSTDSDTVAIDVRLINGACYSYEVTQGGLTGVVTVEVGSVELGLLMDFEFMVPRELEMASEKPHASWYCLEDSPGTCVSYEPTGNEPPRWIGQSASAEFGWFKCGSFNQGLVCNIWDVVGPKGWAGLYVYNVVDVGRLVWSANVTLKLDTKEAVHCRLSSEETANCTGFSVKMRATPTAYDVPATVAIEDGLVYTVKSRTVILDYGVPVITNLGGDVMTHADMVGVEHVARIVQCSYNEVPCDCQLGKDFDTLVKAELHLDHNPDGYVVTCGNNGSRDDGDMRKPMCTYSGQERNGQLILQSTDWKLIPDEHLSCIEDANVTHVGQKWHYGFYLHLFNITFDMPCCSASGRHLCLVTVRSKACTIKTGGLCHHEVKHGESKDSASCFVEAECDGGIPSFRLNGVPVQGNSSVSVGWGVSLHRGWHKVVSGMSDLGQTSGISGFFGRISGWFGRLGFHFSLFGGILKWVEWVGGLVLVGLSIWLMVMGNSTIGAVLLVLAAVCVGVSYGAVVVEDRGENYDHATAIVSLCLICVALARAYVVRFVGHLIGKHVRTVVEQLEVRVRDCRLDWLAYGFVLIGWLHVVVVAYLVHATLAEYAVMVWLWSNHLWIGLVNLENILRAGYQRTEVPVPLPGGFDLWLAKKIHWVLWSWHVAYPMRRFSGKGNARGVNLSNSTALLPAHLLPDGLLYDSHVIPTGLQCLRLADWDLAVLVPDPCSAALGDEMIACMRSGFLANVDDTEAWSPFFFADRTIAGHVRFERCGTCGMRGSAWLKGETPVASHADASALIAWWSSKRLSGTVVRFGPNGDDGRFFPRCHDYIQSERLIRSVGICACTVGAMRRVIDSNTVPLAVMTREDELSQFSYNLSWLTATNAIGHIELAGVSHGIGWSARPNYAGEASVLARNESIVGPLRIVVHDSNLVSDHEVIGEAFSARKVRYVPYLDDVPIDLGDPSFVACSNCSSRSGYSWTGMKPSKAVQTTKQVDMDKARLGYCCVGDQETPGLLKIRVQAERQGDMVRAKVLIPCPCNNPLRRDYAMVPHVKAFKVSRHDHHGQCVAEDCSAMPSVGLYCTKHSKLASANVVLRGRCSRKVTGPSRQCWACKDAGKRVMFCKQCGFTTCRQCEAKARSQLDDDTQWIRSKFDRHGNMVCQKCSDYAGNVHKKGKIMRKDVMTVDGGHILHPQNILPAAEPLTKSQVMEEYCRVAGGNSAVLYALMSAQTMSLVVVERVKGYEWCTNTRKESFAVETSAVKRGEIGVNRCIAGDVILKAFRVATDVALAAPCGDCTDSDDDDDGAECDEGACSLSPQAPRSARHRRSKLFRKVEARPWSGKVGDLVSTVLDRIEKYVTGDDDTVPQEDLELLDVAVGYTGPTQGEQGVEDDIEEGPSGESPGAEAETLSEVEQTRRILFENMRTSARNIIMEGKVPTLTVDQIDQLEKTGAEPAVVSADVEQHKSTERGVLRQRMRCLANAKRNGDKAAEVLIRLGTQKLDISACEGMVMHAAGLWPGHDSVEDAAPCNVPESIQLRRSDGTPVEVSLVGQRFSLMSGPALVYGHSSDRDWTESWYGSSGKTCCVGKEPRYQLSAGFNEAEQRMEMCVSGHTLDFFSGNPPPWTDGTMDDFRDRVENLGAENLSEGALRCIASGLGWMRADAQGSLSRMDRMQQVLNQQICLYLFKRMVGCATKTLDEGTAEGLEVLDDYVKSTGHWDKRAWYQTVCGQRVANWCQSIKDGLGHEGVVFRAALSGKIFDEDDLRWQKEVARELAVRVDTKSIVFDDGREIILCSPSERGPVDLVALGHDGLERDGVLYASASPAFELEETRACATQVQYAYHVRQGDAVALKVRIRAFKLSTKRKLIILGVCDGLAQRLQELYGEEGVIGQDSDLESELGVPQVVPAKATKVSPASGLGINALPGLALKTGLLNCRRTLGQHVLKAIGVGASTMTAQEYANALGEAAQSTNALVDIRQYDCAKSGGLRMGRCIAACWHTTRGRPIRIQVNGAERTLECAHADEQGDLTLYGVVSDWHVREMCAEDVGRDFIVVATQPRVVYLLRYLGTEAGIGDRGPTHRFAPLRKAVSADGVVTLEEIDNPDSRFGLSGYPIWDPSDGSCVGLFASYYKFGVSSDGGAVKQAACGSSTGNTVPMRKSFADVIAKFSDDMSNVEHAVVSGPTGCGKSTGVPQDFALAAVARPLWQERHSANILVMTPVRANVSDMFGSISGTLSAVLNKKKFSVSWAMRSREGSSEKGNSTKCLAGPGGNVIISTYGHALTQVMLGKMQWTGVIMDEWHKSADDATVLAAAVAYSIAPSSRKPKMLYMSATPPGQVAHSWQELSARLQGRVRIQEAPKGKIGICGSQVDVAKMLLPNAVNLFCCPSRNACEYTKTAVEGALRKTTGSDSRSVVVYHGGSKASLMEASQMTSGVICHTNAIETGVNIRNTGNAFDSGMRNRVIVDVILAGTDPAFAHDVTHYVGGERRGANWAEVEQFAGRLSRGTTTHSGTYYYAPGFTPEPVDRPTMGTLIEVASLLRKHGIVIDATHRMHIERLDREACNGQWGLERLIDASEWVQRQLDGDIGQSATNKVLWPEGRYDLPEALRLQMRSSDLLTDSMAKAIWGENFNSVPWKKHFRHIDEREAQNQGFGGGVLARSGWINYVHQREDCSFGGGIQALLGATFAGAGFTVAAVGAFVSMSDMRAQAGIEGEHEIIDKDRWAETLSALINHPDDTAHAICGWDERMFPHPQDDNREFVVLDPVCASRVAVQLEKAEQAVSGMVQSTKEAVLQLFGKLKHDAPSSEGASAPPMPDLDRDDANGVECWHAIRALQAWAASPKMMFELPQLVAALGLGLGPAAATIMPYVYQACADLRARWLGALIVVVSMLGLSQLIGVWTGLGLSLLSIVIYVMQAVKKVNKASPGQRSHVNVSPSGYVASIVAGITTTAVWSSGAELVKFARHWMKAESASTASVWLAQAKSSLGQSVSSFKDYDLGLLSALQDRRAGIGNVLPSGVQSNNSLCISVLRKMLLVIGNKDKYSHAEISGAVFSALRDFLSMGVVRGVASSVIIGGVLMALMAQDRIHGLQRSVANGTASNSKGYDYTTNKEDAREDVFGGVKVERLCHVLGYVLAVVEAVVEPASVISAALAIPVVLTKWGSGVIKREDMLQAFGDRATLYQGQPMLVAGIVTFMELMGDMRGIPQIVSAARRSVTNWSASPLIGVFVSGDSGRIDSDMPGDITRLVSKMSASVKGSWASMVAGASGVTWKQWVGGLGGTLTSAAVVAFAAKLCAELISEHVAPSVRQRVSDWWHSARQSVVVAEKGSSVIDEMVRVALQRGSCNSPSRVEQVTTERGLGLDGYKLSFTSGTLTCRIPVVCDENVLRAHLAFVYSGVTAEDVQRMLKIADGVAQCDDGVRGRLAGYKWIVRTRVTQHNGIDQHIVWVDLECDLRQDELLRRVVDDVLNVLVSGYSLFWLTTDVLWAVEMATCEYVVTDGACFGTKTDSVSCEASCVYGGPRLYYVNRHQATWNVGHPVCGIANVLIRGRDTQGNVLPFYSDRGFIGTDGTRLMCMHNGQEHEWQKMQVGESRYLGNRQLVLVKETAYSWFLKGVSCWSDGWWVHKEGRLEQSCRQDLSLCSESNRQFAVLRGYRPSCILLEDDGVLLNYPQCDGGMRPVSWSRYCDYFERPDSLVEEVVRGGSDHLALEPIDTGVAVIDCDFKRSGAGTQLDIVNPGGRLNRLKELAAQAAAVQQTKRFAFVAAPYTGKSSVAAKLGSRVCDVDDVVSKDRVAWWVKLARRGLDPLVTKAAWKAVEMEFVEGVERAYIDNLPPILLCHSDGVAKQLGYTIVGRYVSVNEPPKSELERHRGWMEARSRGWTEITPQEFERLVEAKLQLSPYEPLQRFEKGDVIDSGRWYYFGADSVLSNMHVVASKFSHNDMLWDCVERAYTYEKSIACGKRDIAVQIRDAEDGAACKRLAKALRSHLWDGIKRERMMAIIRSRAKGDPRYARVLRDSTVESFHECNPNDLFWGTGRCLSEAKFGQGKGENRMGMCLLQLRSELLDAMAEEHPVPGCVIDESPEIFFDAVEEQDEKTVVVSAPAPQHRWCVGIDEVYDPYMWGEAQVEAYMPQRDKGVSVDPISLEQLQVAKNALWNIRGLPRGDKRAGRPSKPDPANFGFPSIGPVKMDYLQATCPYVTSNVGKALMTAEGNAGHALGVALTKPGVQVKIVTKDGTGREMPFIEGLKRACDSDFEVVHADIRSLPLEDPENCAVHGPYDLLAFDGGETFDSIRREAKWVDDVLYPSVVADLVSRTRVGSNGSFKFITAWSSAFKEVTRWYNKTVVVGQASATWPSGEIYALCFGRREKPYPLEWMEPLARYANGKVLQKWKRARHMMRSGVESLPPLQHRVKVQRVGSVVFPRLGAHEVPEGFGCSPVTISYGGREVTYNNRAPELVDHLRACGKIGRIHKVQPVMKHVQMIGRLNLGSKSSSVPRTQLNYVTNQLIGEGLRLRPQFLTEGITAAVPEKIPDMLKGRIDFELPVVNRRRLNDLAEVYRIIGEERFVGEKLRLLEFDEVEHMINPKGAFGVLDNFRPLFSKHGYSKKEAPDRMSSLFLPGVREEIKLDFDRRLAKMCQGQVSDMHQTINQKYEKKEKANVVSGSIDVSKGALKDFLHPSPCRAIQYWDAMTRLIEVAIFGALVRYDSEHHWYPSGTIGMPANNIGDHMAAMAAEVREENGTQEAFVVGDLSKFDAHQSPETLALESEAIKAIYHESAHMAIHTMTECNIARPGVARNGMMPCVVGQRPSGELKTSSGNGFLNNGVNLLQMSIVLGKSVSWCMKYTRMLISGDDHVIIAPIWACEKLVAAGDVIWREFGHIVRNGNFLGYRLCYRLRDADYLSHWYVLVMVNGEERHLPVRYMTTVLAKVVLTLKRQATDPSYDEFLELTQSLMCSFAALYWHIRVIRMLAVAVFYLVGWDTIDDWELRRRHGCVFDLSTFRNMLRKVYGAEPEAVGYIPSREEVRLLNQVYYHLRLADPSLPERWPEGNIYAFFRSRFVDSIQRLVWPHTVKPGQCWTGSSILMEAPKHPWRDVRGGSEYLEMCPYFTEELVRRGLVTWPQQKDVSLFERFRIWWLQSQGETIVRAEAELMIEPGEDSSACDDVCELVPEVFRERSTKCLLTGERPRGLVLGRDHDDGNTGDVKTHCHRCSVRGCRHFYRHRHAYWSGENHGSPVCPCCRASSSLDEE